MTGSHITIVTFAWPPRNTVAVHRPYSWARYWSEAGAKVRVLTAKKYAYDAPLDLDLSPLSEVEVIEVDYAKWTRTLLEPLFSSQLKGPIRWLFRKIRRSSVQIRNPREAWFNAVEPMLEQWAQDTDYVVSTYDPRSVHQIAAAMKKANPTLKWIADYRDPWSLNPLAEWTASQREAERSIEFATVGCYADLITSVSTDIARQQGELLGKPWLTVTNGFDVDRNTVSEAVDAGLKIATRPLRIVYTGKIYPRLYDPSPLFRAIALLEAEGHVSKGDVQIHVYGDQVEGMEAILRNGDYEHMLRLHGHVTRERALLAQRKADLLLLLGGSQPEVSGILTGKIFEYMATGVPILSLGSRRESAIGKLLEQTRTGLCTEDRLDLICDAILCRIESKNLGWFTPDLSEILSYSRENQAMKLLNAMVR